MNIKLVLLVISLSLVAFTSNADRKVLENDVQLVFMGIDPATQGLMLEGTSIGEYGSGTVNVLAFPFNLIDTQLSITAQWTFSDASGAIMTGGNSGRLDLGSLIFFERGTILTCFDELSHLCGCAFQLEGVASDSQFIPFVTILQAKASITTVKNGDCLTISDKYKHKNKNDDDDDD